MSIVLGIDASNLRAGGGVTHLVELLRAADPALHGIREVRAWAGQATLVQMPSRPWLTRLRDPRLDRPLPLRAYWQLALLPGLAAQCCDALFVPGGSHAGSYRPLVTMSRNMLPFEVGERQRYGMSWMRLKLWLLRQTQTASLRRADGVIYLTRYARDALGPYVTPARGTRTVIIPHGVSESFRCTPRPQQPVGAYSAQRPFRLLYVSTVDLYKHQWHVVEAVSRLCVEGLPIKLQLAGSAYGPALRRLRASLARHDPAGEFTHYLGSVPYGELARLYRAADAAVFASSCENMPNILLECMAAGLPIACSNRGPMPEILGDAGIYFNPERPDDIAAALRGLLADSGRRAELAWQAYRRAEEYSWARCAHETLGFIAQVAQGS